jgi:3-deoxy-D-manno-octulosonate 8-phosphate phosphatase (KDO 8-P phosphatase)
MAGLEKIKMLVMDVDGVLTDGRIVVGADGSESKNFSVLDGHGIRLWHRAGLKTALVSGRSSPPTKHRAEQLGIEYVLEDCHYKLPAIEKLAEQSGVSAGEMAYIGDDLPDVPAMGCVGFAVAVANGVDEAKEHADYVTKRAGGDGAVREVIEHILKETGKWQGLMERYLPDE